MSGAYTIEHIINEIVQERSRAEMKTGKNPRGMAFYEESWGALNSWIESRMSKRQGASVSPLGEFSWEMKNINGVASCRPIFLLDESFIKDHHIRQKKFHKPTNVAKCEEVNYSKLAIKFSKMLTKDMVFSGVRDIIKKIGDYIDRIYEIEIEFTFGVLRSKERRVRFEFDNARLMQILPESMVDTLADKTLGYTQGFDTERSEDGPLSLTGNKPAPLDFSTTFPSTETTNQSSSDSQRPFSEGRDCSENASKSSPSSSVALHEAESKKPSSAVSSLRLNLTYKDLDRSDPPPPLSPTLQALIMSMDEKSLSRAAKIERRVRACDEVAKQAFGRCLYDVESAAVDDDYTDFQSRLLHQQWQEKQRQLKEKQQKEVSDIHDTLKSQMEMIDKRRHEEVMEKKTGTCGTGLPPLSDSRNILPPEQLKKQKKQMLKALQKQIVSAKVEQDQRKAQTLAQETKQLEVIRSDLDMDRLVSRAAALEKQRDLLEAWEREAHIRNLKKLQTHGADAVKSYMKETAILSQGGNPGGGFSMSSARSGVGFDTRRSRK